MKCHVKMMMTVKGHAPETGYCVIKRGGRKATVRSLSFFLRIATTFCSVNFEFTTDKFVLQAVGKEGTTAKLKI